MTKYTLAELPYDYAALEPHISGKIMELHHDKHHAAYVNGANTTIDALAEARAKGEYKTIAGLERALAFHVSGHVLHSLFWASLSPQGGGKPTGALAEGIERDFGGFDAFKRHFNEAAATVMGSGWAGLAWEPMGRRLVVVQIYDHQSNMTQGGQPIMVADAWEHAFYLQYQNRKTEFFEALWNLWNWTDIGKHYVAVSEIVTPLSGAK
jgi:Fe-Mn family superoxide dismutase